MKINIFLIIILLFVFVNQGRSTVVPLSFSDQNFRVDVKSVKALKEEGVILQTDEFTCGAAALATLLRSYGDEKVTEEELLRREKELEQGKGLSLLQLKILAEKRGFKAAGYQMELANLFDFDKPMLLHVISEGKGHYVAFRGIYKDRIFLADPAVGNVRMSLENFSKIWTGKALAIEERKGKKLKLAFEPPVFAQPELLTVRPAIR